MMFLAVIALPSNPQIRNTAAPLGTFDFNISVLVLVNTSNESTDITICQAEVINVKHLSHGRSIAIIVRVQVPSMATRLCLMRMYEVDKKVLKRNRRCGLGHIK